MDVISVFLIFTSLINLAPAGLIIFRNPSDKVSRTYALFALFVSLWTFGLAMFRNSEFANGLHWAIFYYISASFTVTYFLFFSLLFLNKREKKIKLFLYILFFLPAIFVSLLTLLNINFFTEYRMLAWGKEIKLGISYFFYVLYVLLYSSLSFVFLKNRYKSAEGIERVQFKFVFTGTMVAFVFGIIFNLILPVFTYRFIWVGPFFSVFMVILIAYAISKHHLMDVKTIATELFVGILVAILFVNIFFYGNVYDLWFRIVIFSVASLFGYFLIKSVLKEVRAREKIEELVEKLEFANLRLRQLDEAKSDFISIASHQLRTPLTSIKGYTSMILEGSYGKIPEKARTVIDKVFQSSQRLVLIIGDFLDISHIEQGTMKYDFAKTDLKELAKGIAEEFQATMKNLKDKTKSLKISFEADDKTDFSAMADQSKIRQIVSNLIDNAIKYTPQGFIKISLSKIPENGNILLKTEDSGIGISEENMDNLFKKFGRAKGLSSLYSNGSGLGLYVAKEIVKAHKGKIWAESDGEGKGSKFFVELPVA